MLVSKPNIISVEIKMAGTTGGAGKFAKHLTNYLLDHLTHYQLAIVHCQVDES